jgi:serine/threonine protein phosphatase PrpC
VIVNPLSRDHKPDDPLEASKILENGGRIDSFKDGQGNNVGPMRVWLKNEDIPGLAMSRSFGDTVSLLAGVTAEPEVKEFTLSKEDKMLVIASDGVWEFLSN